MDKIAYINKKTFDLSQIKPRKIDFSNENEMLDEY